ncbi:hypothetical protein ACFSC4_16005 [Deinococcus malanensis]|uniref:hypothetical protein n=1 Tax=Deinococcus malanensis TaxID=1706855 RepID=UPI00362CBFB6
MSVPLYPPLSLQVITPRLKLHGATDDLLARLFPVVRAGVVERQPYPFDDPMALYEDNPVRERKWLQAIWRGAATFARIPGACTSWSCWAISPWGCRI